MNKCQRTPKRKSQKDNPEKLATQSTQDDDKQNKNTEHTRRRQTKQKLNTTKHK